MPKYITINTDASWCSKTKVGGYAFYIICDLFRIRKSGSFQTPCLSSDEAEARCIANALHTLVSQKELPETDFIILNTDSMACIRKIGNHNDIKVYRIINECVTKLKSRLTKDEISPSFQARHVKAHTNKNDARSHVNKWCDTMAKQHMRQLRKDYKKKW